MSEKDYKLGAWKTIAMLSELSSQNTVLKIFIETLCGKIMFCQKNIQTIP